jgi:hypothetical protein
MAETWYSAGGFWTVAIGPSNQDLYYLLRWESLAEREKKWSAFAADPEWLEARARTEKDGRSLLPWRTDSSADDFFRG